MASLLFKQILASYFRTGQRSSGNENGHGLFNLTVKTVVNPANFSDPSIMKLLMAQVEWYGQ
ncbi:MAG TPA: hypothetical protein DCZ48_15770 [Methylococcaceae bacterium]|nr:hypothetical protein [Methylococcaceae bacterium]